MIGPVLDAFRQPGFALGLRPALAALAVGMALAVLFRATGRRSPPPVAGLLLGAAAAVGLSDADLLPPGLPLALATLAAGGLAVELARLPRPLVAVAALPGAWLISQHTDLVTVDWIRYLVGATVVVGAVLLCDFDAQWRHRGAAPVLLAVTAFGVYATVPDTEQALVVLGPCLVIALLGWPWPAASIGAGGACVTAGLLAWTAAAGGFGRPSSIIGAVGSLGLLVAEPVGRRLAGRRSRPPEALVRNSWAILALAAGQVLLVAVESRVAGLRATVAPAAVIAAAALIVAVGVVAVTQSGRPAEPNRRRRAPVITSERGSSAEAAS